MKRSCLLTLTLLLAPVMARAVDGGEISIGAGADIGLADVYNPFAEYPAGTGGAAEALSFTSLIVDFGLSDSLAIGAGARVSFPASTRAYGVNYGRFGPGILEAEVMNVLIPVRLTYQYTAGSDFGWMLHLEGGAEMSRWTMQTFDAPKPRPGDPGLFYRPDTLWHKNIYARVGIACQWRPIDHATFSGGPFFQKMFSGGWAFGLMFQGDLVVGAAPSLEN